MPGAARSSGKTPVISPDFEHLDFESIQRILLKVYRTMYDHFGELHWWPADTVEEMIIGAILVQNVSWKNTEIAITRLREADLLTFTRLYDADLALISECVRSTRFHRLKARKLKAFAEHVVTRYNGSADAMLGQPMGVLRQELLGIWGIGAETADDILLYGAEHPSFVIDAYTKRIFHRMGLIRENPPYEALRTWFMAYLPADTALFNRYHAMLDAVGHRYCALSNPRCGECPLVSLCRTGGGSVAALVEASGH